MPATLMYRATPTRLHRRRRAARWWLASLLVSCLLPVNLPVTRAAGNPARCACAAVWAPVVLRARSWRLARRLPRWRQRVRHFHRQRLCLRPRHNGTAFPVAALDVVSRRGPPGSAPMFR